MGFIYFITTGHIQHQITRMILFIDTKSVSLKTRIKLDTYDSYSKRFHLISYKKAEPDEIL